MHLIFLDCPATGRVLPTAFTARGAYLSTAAAGVRVRGRLVYPNGDVREATAVRQHTALDPAARTLAPVWSCHFAGLPPSTGVLLRAMLFVDGLERAANLAHDLEIAVTGGADCP